MRVRPGPAAQQPPDGHDQRGDRVGQRPPDHRLAVELVPVAVGDREQQEQDERCLGREVRGCEPAARYSHSIVPGGFDEMSSATRFTPATSFTIRLEIVSSRSYGRRAQSAVIASSEVTARMMIGCS